jgi:mannan endo-1,4-beta-mannosidase
LNIYAHQLIGSPSGTYNSGSQPWYRNFYTEATSFDVANAMSNVNSNDYKLLVRDIDAIASQLKRVRDANIPVLWRPLHEAEGGWFWWGAKGPDACKKLYRLMYDRMTNYHGLNNLLWVWNSVNSSWYPGNDVVDVVSTDYYGTAGDHSSQSNLYKSLRSLTGNTKAIALGEVGNIPDPVNTRQDGANWAYWMVWNGDFIKGTSYNPLQYKYNIFSSQYILTRDEISGWKG